MSAIMTEPLYTCLAFGFILLSLPVHFILERYGYIPKDNIHHNISTITISYDNNISSYEKLTIPDKTINRFAILSADDDEEERGERKEDIELSLLNNNTSDHRNTVKAKKLTYVKGHNSEDGLNLLSNKNEEIVDL